MERVDWPSHPKEVSLKILRAQYRSPISVAVIAIAFLLQTAAGAQQQQGPPPPKNLKVLPQGTDVHEVITLMKGFTRGLGVRCQHCHVYKGDNPDDLKSFDFASDEKAEKQTARTMMRMVQAINNDYLKDVGQPRPAGEMKVTCYTCHRGEIQPRTRKTEG